jgi:hypothetical protein
MLKLEAVVDPSGQEHCLTMTQHVEQQPRWLVDGWVAVEDVDHGWSQYGYQRFQDA